MKYYILVAAIVIIGFASACKKHTTAPKFGKPNWAADTTGKYPYSMTAVVQLPADLEAHFQQGDELGAFIGGECRGVAQRIQADSSFVYFVQIHGTASEEANIRFEYFSSRSSYLYQTDYYLAFEVDGNFGTADKPQLLPLKVVK